MSSYYQDDGRARSSSRHARDYRPDYPASRPSGSPRRSGDSFVRETLHIEPPPGHSSSSRPRSVPPPEGREVVPRGRSPSLLYDDDYHNDRSRSFSSSRSRGRGGDYRRDESPMSRARSVMNDHFTNSGVGIGAGLVGAIAGGFAGREVSERVAHRNHGNKRRRRSEADKDEAIRLASTLLGAAIGGLSANALTKQYERSRDREHVRERAWEDTYDYGSRRGLKDREPDGYGDDYDYVYDRRDDRKHLAY